MSPPDDREWLPDRDDGESPDERPEPAGDETAPDAPDRTPEEDLDAGLEGDEPGGLGLTEEFARIEAEIQADAERDPAHEGAPPPADAPGPAADEGSEPDEGPPGHAEAGLHRRPDAEAQDVDPELAADEPDAEEPMPAAEEVDGGSLDAGSDAAEDHEDHEDAAEEDEDAEDFEDAAEDEDAEDFEDAAEDEGPEDAEEHREAAEQGTPAAAQTVIRPMPRPPAPVAVGIPEDELEDSTPSLWLRFLTGSILIVASVAAAVAALGLLFLNDVAAKLQPIPGVQAQLAEVDPGSPQTIMIIGSDRRADTDKTDKRSDTTMLVRVDPDKAVLSLFSLPRDLKVDIPGVGVDKLNAAYTAGGAKLTVETVKRFMDIDVNHVVEINFNGFADAVNAIDCVYIDVDRDYFNVNDGTVANDYADIDINSGYQRLCGLKALQYVRYRHTDTDLVRAARQQDFLREARQKVQPRELLGAINPLSSGGTGNELIDIFTEYTRSDIDDEDDVIGILKSFAAMRNVPVNEVHFQGDIGGPDNPFVTSTDKQVGQAKDEFLNGAGTSGQRGGEKATKKDGGEKKKKKKDKKDKDPTAGANVVDTEALADTKFPTLAERFAADAAKNARRLRIPVFYPTRVVPGSSFSPDSRTYEYENEDNKKESAYKTVITYQPSGLTEYYGVMGTTWDDPPILRNPSETRKIDGREYLLFYDGGRLRLVGWQEDGNSYWLNNTLVQSIGEAEMLAIATTMREV